MHRVVSRPWTSLDRIIIGTGVDKPNFAESPTRPKVDHLSYVALKYGMFSQLPNAMREYQYRIDYHTMAMIEAQTPLLPLSRGPRLFFVDYRSIGARYCGAFVSSTTTASFYSPQQSQDSRPTSPLPFPLNLEGFLPLESLFLFASHSHYSLTIPFPTLTGLSAADPSRQIRSSVEQGIDPSSSAEASAPVALISMPENKLPLKPEVLQRLVKHLRPRSMAVSVSGYTGAIPPTPTWYSFPGIALRAQQANARTWLGRELKRDIFHYRSPIQYTYVRHGRVYNWNGD
ncbi:hypothetical protein BDN72DRAFT_855626 [Pluteus cervinus]|uniref:Uncharacterized protein n=1 Tax=Pluteus cervinus TaxID=181527 RepID=A0ACD3B205_9AGAR|nr:hypothetical protein BDN72DRAFT_855626 [Pluteus cervinus]